MLKWIYRLLPVCLFIKLVKKVGCEEISYGDNYFFMPYRDIIIRKFHHKEQENISDDLYNLMVEDNLSRGGDRTKYYQRRKEFIEKWGK